MGNNKQARLIVLVLLLAVAAFLVHGGRETPVTTQKSRDLQTVFGPIPGYSLAYQSPLTEEVYRFLDLDDYTSVGYAQEGAVAPVGLYIGYYFSLDKVSAAHSPLVCFPGQGWTLDQPKKRRLDIGGHAINLAEVVARVDNRQELILYWYQAGETTAPEVYRNKFNAVLNKMNSKSQEHAFVRVSVPFTGDTADQARAAGEKFIATFYPVFLAYIAESAPATH